MTSSPSAGDAVPLVEVCVDSIASARLAAAAGADRLELCADRATGGLTPSPGLLSACLERVAVPVFAMVRPRGGDFCYDADEREAMRRDIVEHRARGASGIVVGALVADGTVDVDGMRVLLEAARPLPVTFHRAFDCTRDAEAALAALIALGVDRVLTSGFAATAHEGLPCLARLVASSRERVVVVAGGGVRSDHAAEIVTRAGVRELHTGASIRVEGPMRFRSSRAVIGREERHAFTREVADVEEIARLIRVVRSATGLGFPQEGTARR